jgi:RNA polymerase sigma-70 factor (ECF subfamily)
VTEGVVDAMTDRSDQPDQPDQSELGDGRLDPGPGAIVSERRRLINLAYRLLGSLTEAEDVVQETYARWYAMSPQQRGAVESPGGWLTRVASRICLDLLGSARTRGNATWANGSPSRCPNAPSGSPRGPTAAASPSTRPTRPTG